MDKEYFGKRIAMAEILSYYDEPFSLIHYISGIEEFDEFLGYKPFSETSCWHSVLFYENAIEFVIGLDDSSKSKRIAFEKSGISDVIIEKNKKIKIRSFNKKSKALKTGALGNGAAGVLITSAIGAVSDKLTTKIMGISSKEVNGTAFQIHLKVNNEDKIIKLSCIEEHTDEAIKFLEKRFQTIPDPEPNYNSSACYIATVCYNDNMAPEVIKFREFRDKHLKKNFIGKKFIKLYYANAESISKKLADKPFTNKLVKTILLDPVYLIIKLFV